MRACVEATAQRLVRMRESARARAKASAHAQKFKFLKVRMRRIQIFESAHAQNIFIQIRLETRYNGRITWNNSTEC